MAKMPGAEWRPLGTQTEPRITPLVWCLHSMAGSFAGTQQWFETFNGPGYQGTESHFGVAFDGRIRQWQDTGRQADANGPDGGMYILSIETEDDGTPDDTPWTPKQMEAIARILAWGHAEHAIPVQRAAGAGRQFAGVAIHRDGIDPWRRPGHDRWSTSRGKTCPGEARIRQVPAVIARARILAGLDKPSGGNGSSAALPTKGSTMIMLGQIVGRDEIFVGNSQTSRHIRRPSSVLRVQGSVRDWTADPDATTVWTYADLDEMQDVMGMLVTDPVDWSDLEDTEKAILADLKAAPVRVADELRNRLTA
jgi:hypothetical protein